MANCEEVATRQIYGFLFCCDHYIEEMHAYYHKKGEELSRKLDKMKEVFDRALLLQKKDFDLRYDKLLSEFKSWLEMISRKDADK